MVFFTIRAIFTMIRDRRIENNSAFFIIKIYRFRANLQNATHFVGVAYPPNKISKTVLKMQAFYTCFMKFCLALNSYRLFNLSSTALFVLLSTSAWAWIVWINLLLLAFFRCTDCAVIFVCSGYFCNLFSLHFLLNLNVE